MSRRTAFLTAGLAALTLTACTTEQTPADEDSKHLEEAHLEEAHLRLHDGREITCITYHGYKQGGLSCDWGAHQ